MDMCTFIDSKYIQTTQSLTYINAIVLHYITQVCIFVENNKIKHHEKYKKNAYRLRTNN